jgi:ribosomal protein S18 acetylase RimI-like enzyme
MKMIIKSFSQTWRSSLETLFAAIFDPSELPYFEETLVDEKSYVAIDKKKVVGFLIVSDTPGKFFGKQISYLAVDEAYRNQGIATKLLARLKTGVWLEVLDSNETACKFYETRGFIRHKQFTTKDGCAATVFIRCMQCP